MLACADLPPSTPRSDPATAAMTAASRRPHRLQSGHGVSAASEDLLETAGIDAPSDKLRIVLRAFMTLEGKLATSLS